MSRSTTILFLCLILAACSALRGSRNGTRDDTAERSTADETRVAEYETFDPSPYQESPPDVTFNVEHHVPERLMKDRADKGVARTVEGYRIQIFSTQEKVIAEQKLGEAQDWWQDKKDEAPSGLFRGDLPAVIEYQQPYYRVRIGGFAERKQAEEALTFVKRKYPDAFIARTTVTVTN